MSLHELRIVHCDVKGDNIFISNENGHYIVKLGVRTATIVRPIFSFHFRISIFLIDSDWTHHQETVSALEAHWLALYVSACEISETSSRWKSNQSTAQMHSCLFVDFKPPEPEYVFVSDIWALGCTIIEMLTGKVKLSGRILGVGTKDTCLPCLVPLDTLRSSARRRSRLYPWSANGEEGTTNPRRRTQGNGSLWVRPPVFTTWGWTASISSRITQSSLSSRSHG